MLTPISSNKSPLILVQSDPYRVSRISIAPMIVSPSRRCSSTSSRMNSSRTGPQSLKASSPEASRAPLYAYTSRPKNVWLFWLPAKRFVSTCSSRTSFSPIRRSMCVSVPLSGVTTMCPSFVNANQGFPIRSDSRIDDADEDRPRRPIRKGLG